MSCCCWVKEGKSSENSDLSMTSPLSTDSSVTTVLPDLAAHGVTRGALLGIVLNKSFSVVFSTYFNTNSVTVVSDWSHFLQSGWGCLTQLITSFMHNDSMQFKILNRFLSPKSLDALDGIICCLKCKAGLRLDVSVALDSAFHHHSVT